MGRRAIAIVLVLVGLRGQAAAMDDIDTERARALFKEGEALYLVQNYRSAVQAFRAAAAILPRPEFDFDLARSYDHLDELDAAIDAYERYLAWKPVDADLPEVERRLVKLRRRRAARRSVWLPATIGGLALVSGAIGAGLVGSAPARYDVIANSGCAPRCAFDEVGRAKAADYAGITMLAVGGVLLVVDVALWVTQKRRAERIRGSMSPP